jgi:hypothetical protein
LAEGAERGPTRSLLEKVEPGDEQILPPREQREQGSVSSSVSVHHFQSPWLYKTLKSSAVASVENPCLALAHPLPHFFEYRSTRGPLTLGRADIQQHDAHHVVGCLG